ncbi:cold-shock protein [Agrobacterium vitis]|nr:cold-shock protein [Allorhizobium ampelinum]
MLNGTFQMEVDFCLGMASIIYGIHDSATERAGIRSLNDGQKISYELVKDRRSGKMSADNLEA